MIWIENAIFLVLYLKWCLLTNSVTGYCGLEVFVQVITVGSAGGALSY